ncbi:glycine betaine ABC transporter substrate-binding protein [Actinomadura xylanilytica]|uniref:glycine betaine ABC transporter substrate-binding protein n=1 Tax=Actinomadura xylanilytica TaxID=887459 RepID=UPI00255AF69A|nr:glycine betaine ABC transporter substrate-binding protein [Actinomadura xylanilytica]MDL4777456.1 glycine betaine ABC transporter substrate-binding protein [Actinomadura xylanilytica]
MRRAHPTLALLGAVLLGPATLGLSGCGLKPASAFLPAIEPGTIKPIKNLEGARLRVTSKEFTEQIVLGKLAVLALTAAGAKVQDNTNVQGSVTARLSITGGDNDLMWEYTGTGWITYLGRTEPIVDPQRQFDAVAALDLKKHHIAWLPPPAPLNNTYTIAVSPATQRKYGLTDLSQLSSVPVGQRTICTEPEFFSRNDGLRGMLAAYGLKYGSGVPAKNVMQMSAGVVYNSVKNGKCTFGQVTATDGRIQALDLKVLKDDKHFFPNYNPAITVRESVLKAHPELTPIFAQISPKLTTEVMRTLNSKVDVDGDDPVFVARDWMRAQGFIK